MTIAEARAHIPPGWVECDEEAYEAARELIWKLGGYDWTVYAIPAPKPEPRRVPMGEMVVFFDNDGYLPHHICHHETIRNACGGHKAVANTKWRLDPDAREWVEEAQ